MVLISLLDASWDEGSDRDVAPGRRRCSQRIGLKFRKLKATSQTQKQHQILHSSTRVLEVCIASPLYDSREILS
ncbi:hypothetical protein SISSUDRAFT_1044501 [Sistotremastrum suecicum HHB10207 ss-3]|uniref:Uncharacterized protein n=1 Tax=Sistotremastrum suecicum HHB10207 ss-3 TaxID=1314776 RepID=A0A166F4B9_9AGAM|nr:hypothetical protein SISSUDRAFT_1044501 [Sistotremastrum suecicum HHB10207 ss-3]